MHDLEKAVLGLLLWVFGSNRLESIIPADASRRTLLKHALIDGLLLVKQVLNMALVVIDDRWRFNSPV